MSPKNVQVGLAVVVFALVPRGVLLGFSGQGNVEDGFKFEHPRADSPGEFLDLFLNVGEEGV